MRRVQKVLSGVFLGGVLLGGIGTGVALVEYSSLAYAGEKHLGEENLVTRQLDYSMAPGTEEVWLIKSYWDEAEAEADESVPEGIIRYEITYNEKLVRPVLSYEEDKDQEELSEAEESLEGQVEAEESTEGEPEAEESTEEGQEAEKGVEGKPEEEENEERVPGKIRRKTLLHLSIRNTGNDFAVWMACKDEILAELKKKRIFSYDMTPVTDLTIKVNPRTMPLVHSEDSGILYFRER
jgi:Cobalamin biosynthesis protein CobT (nicotinate-mononucleotide:5, 6-dimethylbenzimidazole phosphoribosyltransferase)